MFIQVLIVLLHDQLLRVRAKYVDEEGLVTSVTAETFGCSGSSSSTPMGKGIPWLVSKQGETPKQQ